jgi:hypothetical protein
LGKWHYSFLPHTPDPQTNTQFLDCHRATASQLFSLDMWTTQILSKNNRKIMKPKWIKQKLQADLEKRNSAVVAAATMAVASLQFYPLLNSPPVSVSRSFSARTPVPRRTGIAVKSRLRLCCCSQSAERRSPDNSPPQLERLFSNVNQATMKHEPGNHAQIMQSAILWTFIAELCLWGAPDGIVSLFLTWLPGSVTGSILLVAGTTVMLLPFYHPHSKSWNIDVGFMMVPRCYDC